jgi:hypothetical protein
MLVYKITQIYSSCKNSIGIAESKKNVAESLKNKQIGS